MRRITFSLPDALADALKARQRAEGHRSLNETAVQLLSAAFGYAVELPSWGGDRLSKRLRGAYIDVRNGRVVVMRAGREAENWQEIEDAAIREIERQGGALTLSGVYACPTELAEQAVFPD